MRVRLVGFALAIVLLGSATAFPDTLTARPKTSKSAKGAKDGRPPHTLHLVNGHWTAWNPPALESLPPDAQIYTIAKGDTLWDLAKRFHGNPYLWPQLWERNQYILDAHWIYPGDPLVTGLQVAPVQNLAQTGAGGGQAIAPGEQPIPPPAVPGVEAAVKAVGAPNPLGAESDIYCSGYVGDSNEQFPYVISGSEFDNLQAKLHTDYRQLKEITGPGTAKVDLSVGDIIYLTSSGGPMQGLTPGSVFTVIGTPQPVIHPLTGKAFGSFYPYQGRVRVLSVQETTAIAEITHGCDPIQLGFTLRPFEPEPVPLGRATAQRPVNMPVGNQKLQDAATIIFARDVISLGTDHTVFIDRGSDQNVTPGDVFTIYRPSERGMPSLPLGEVAVLSVQKRSALAKIIESRWPIYLGDRLDPK
jgi:hypothetical protein